MSGRSERPVGKFEAVRGEAEAARTSRACAEALEGVYARVRELPAILDRGAAAAALTAALAALARVAESPPDDPEHLPLLEAATAAVAQVVEALAPAEADALGKELLETARGAEAALRACRPRAIGDVVARPARAPTPAAGAATPFLASVGLPRLHRAAAQGAAPLVDLGPLREEDGDADVVDLTAEVEGTGEDSQGGRGGRGGERGEGGGEREEIAALRRLAYDCLVDIARLGEQCRVGALDPWSTSAPLFEQRLLDNLDALLCLAARDEAAPGPACLDVVREAQDFVARSPALDPGRAFARTFVLSCIDGEAPARAAVLGLRLSDPRTVERQRDALVRGSSPAIARAMRGLCAAEEPALIRLALDALRLRGEVLLADAAPLLGHPHPGVRQAAARCLAWTGDRSLAVPLLLPMLGEDEDERVAAAAAESLVALGAPEGLAHARAAILAELDEPDLLAPAVRLDLLDLLAVAGGAADHRLLVRSLRGAPREALALGWSGRAEAVEPLLAALEGTGGAGMACRFLTPEDVAKSPPYPVALAEALHRITGLGRSAIATARERGPDGSALPALTDPAAWRARWTEHGRALPRGVRCRFGQPHTPSASLDELLSTDVRSADRALCALEVAIASGGAARIRLGGWTAAQRRDIELAREMIREVIRERT